MPCCQSYARIYARCFYVCNCPNVCIPKGAVQIHNVHTRVHIVATEGCSGLNYFASPPRAKMYSVIVLPKVQTFCCDDGCNQAVFAQAMTASFKILQARHLPRKASPLPKRTAAPQGLAGNCTSGMRGTLYAIQSLQFPAVKRWHFSLGMKSSACDELAFKSSSNLQRGRRPCRLPSVDPCTLATCLG